MPRGRGGADHGGLRHTGAAGRAAGHAGGEADFRSDCDAVEKAYDDCAAGVPRIRDLIASSEEELARRRRGEAPLPPPPQLKPPAERLADHLSREETLADFVADGED